MEFRIRLFGSLMAGLVASGGLACSTAIDPFLGFDSPLAALITLQGCPTQPVRVGENFSLSAQSTDPQGGPQGPYQYDARDNRMVRVGPSGEVTPLYPGKTELIASADGHSSAPCALEVLPPENSLTVRRITDNALEDNWGANNNWKMIANHQVLWQSINANGDTEIRIHDRGDPLGVDNLVETISFFDGEVDFMAMGSGADPDSTLASFRVGLSETRVSNDGASPVSLGKQQQEENSIADGNFSFRYGDGLNDIRQYSSTQGLRILEDAGETFGPITSEGMAVWESRQGNASNLIFFDGQTQHTVATGLPIFPTYDFRDGRIVYVDQGDIVLVDTLTTPFAVRHISTDGLQKSDRSPRTDGNSVIWHQVDGNEEHIWMHDIASARSEIISTTILPKMQGSLQIDLKQALWVECDALPCLPQNTSLWFHLGSGEATDSEEIDLGGIPLDLFYAPYLDGGVATWIGNDGDTEVFILD